MSSLDDSYSMHTHLRSHHGWTVEIFTWEYYAEREMKNLNFDLPYEEQFYLTNCYFDRLDDIFQEEGQCGVIVDQEW